MIRIIDGQGKIWVFRKGEILSFYFDNTVPNDDVSICTHGASIKFTKRQLYEAVPQVFEGMNIKIN